MLPRLAQLELVLALFGDVGVDPDDADDLAELTAMGYIVEGDAAPPGDDAPGPSDRLAIDGGIWPGGE